MKKNVRFPRDPPIGPRRAPKVTPAFKKKTPVLVPPASIRPLVHAKVIQAFNQKCIRFRSPNIHSSSIGPHRGSPGIQSKSFRPPGIHPPVSPIHAESQSHPGARSKTHPIQFPRHPSIHPLVHAEVHPASNQKVSGSPGIRPLVHAVRQGCSGRPIKSIRSIRLSSIHTSPGQSARAGRPRPTECQRVHT